MIEMAAIPWEPIASAAGAFAAALLSRARIRALLREELPRALDPIHARLDAAEAELERATWRNGRAPAAVERMRPVR